MYLCVLFLCNILKAIGQLKNKTSFFLWDVLFFLLRLCQIFLYRFQKANKFLTHQEPKVVRIPQEPAAGVYSALEKSF